MPDPSIVQGNSLKLKRLIESMEATNEKLRKTITNFKSLSSGTQGFDLARIRTNANKSFQL